MRQIPGDIAMCCSSIFSIQCCFWNQSKHNSKMYLSLHFCRIGIIHVIIIIMLTYWLKHCVRKKYTPNNKYKIQSDCENNSHFLQLAIYSLTFLFYSQLKMFPVYIYSHFEQKFIKKCNNQAQIVLIFPGVHFKAMHFIG